MPYANVMVDLETTGTDPTLHAIIQIAAVTFDFQTDKIGDVFSINMSMPPTRSWDEDTRSWWAKQDPSVFAAVSTDPVHPRVAIHMFQQWVLNNTSAIVQPVLWAKPVSFEFPFLASYFREFEIDNPFHFRSAIDLQSFIRGMRGDPWAPPFDKEVPMVGDVHNAVDDVFHQIAVALAAKHKFRGEGKHHGQSDDQAAPPAVQSTGGVGSMEGGQHLPSDAQVG